jgi:hypothetical protein
MARSNASRPNPFQVRVEVIGCPILATQPKSESFPAPLGIKKLFAYSTATVEFSPSSFDNLFLSIKKLAQVRRPEPGSLFERVLEKYYDSTPDEATLRLLNQKSE